MDNISLSDIAKNLNLSLVTVSMVMNGKAEKWRISEATKQKVLATAKEMGYRKNANARAMITGKTKLIGYMEMNISSEIAARTLQGLADTADNAGYSVKLFTYNTPEGFESALYRAMEHRPAALMYRMRSRENLVLFRKECLKFNIPLMVYGSAHPMEWGLRVSTDDCHGARVAVEHLLSLGHKNIWHIGNPGKNIEFADSRYKGFVDAMLHAGVQSPEHMVLHVEKMESLDFQLQKLLKGNNRPNALFCVSDYMAMQAIRTARKCGLSLPGDLSIVGFADLEMAKFADPPLTTVAEPFEEVGRTAFKLLQAEIENPEKPSFQKEIVEYVDVQLVIRESTAIKQ